MVSIVHLVNYGPIYSKIDNKEGYVSLLLG